MEEEEKEDNDEKGDDIHDDEQINNKTINEYFFQEQIMGRQNALMMYAFFLRWYVFKKMVVGMRRSTIL